LAYELALKAGVIMSPSRIDKIKGRHHTFFTKRFDRNKHERIHFASAMTMTGKNEEIVRDNPAGYLDIADFIQTYGVNVNENLHQLWRRIVFNIAVSNTDDHLRNHGFILTEAGWVLSLHNPEHTRSKSGRKQSRKTARKSGHSGRYRVINE